MGVLCIDSVTLSFPEQIQFCRPLGAYWIVLSPTLLGQCDTLVPSALKANKFSGPLAFWSRQLALVPRTCAPCAQTLRTGGGDDNGDVGDGDIGSILRLWYMTGLGGPPSQRCQSNFFKDHQEWDTPLWSWWGDVKITRMNNGIYEGSDCVCNEKRQNTDNNDINHEN